MGPQAVKVPEIRRRDATMNSRKNVVDAAISSGGLAW
jgi:hypothetical protein